jgi:hypothetical protein
MKVRDNICVLLNNILSKMRCGHLCLHDNTFIVNSLKINSTLTDFKINQFLPSIPKGNWLIFQPSPFRVRGKKAEKLYKNLIGQRIKCSLVFLLFIPFSQVYSQISIPLENGYARVIDQWLVSSNSNTSSFVKPYNVSSFQGYVNLDSILRFGKVNSKASKSWLSRKWSYENFAIVDTGKLKMYIDPLLNLELSRDLKTNSNFFVNTRGIRIMGSIDNIVFFETNFYENQATFPTYITDYIISSKVVPGQANTGFGALRTYRGGAIDFAYSSGSLGWALNKYLNVRIGQGKIFIGDGFRSLLLSDNSFNYPYFQATVSFKKFQYSRIMSVFMADRLPENKFGAREKRLGGFNIFTYMPVHWFEISLFEGSVWKYPNSTKHVSMDYNYYNPVIFINSALSQTNCKSVGGLGLKLNMLKQIQLYGQIATDRNSFDSKGFPLASQIGAKLLLNKLYFQTEFNYSPKDTYTSTDSAFNYSNYNQSLAHPLGTNFTELLFIGQYNLNCWRFALQMSAARYGIASKVINVAGPYKVSDYAFSTPFIGLGRKTDVVNSLVSVAYVINPTSNRLVEAGFAYRNAKLDDNLGNRQLNYFYVAFKTALTNGFWGY